MTYFDKTGGIQRSELFRELRVAIAALCVALAGGIIIWIITQQPNYLNFLYLSCIPILLFLSVLLKCYPGRSSSPTSPSTVPKQETSASPSPYTSQRRKRLWAIIGIVSAIGFTVAFFFIGPILFPVFPVFEITNPVLGQQVEMIYMVSGHGGLIGATVLVEVTDPLGKEWTQTKTSTIDNRGIWNVPNVRFGIPEDSTKEFLIVAKYSDKNGNWYYTKQIKVVRK